MARFTKRIYSTGIDAVVVITNQMCDQSGSEDVWKKSITEFLDHTGNVPLGLYECPKPHLRLLSPETLKWAAETGRFYFHKDVSCSIPMIKDKLDALSSITVANNFKFYNANMATLSDSVILGGNGFCGIAANMYPHLICNFNMKTFDSDSLDAQESRQRKIKGKSTDDAEIFDSE